MWYYVIRNEDVCAPLRLMLIMLCGDFHKLTIDEFHLMVATLVDK